MISTHSPTPTGRNGLLPGFWRWSAAGLLLLAISTVVRADAHAPPADASAPLPVDPQVRAGRLQNGLTYYLRSNATPERRVLLWLVVNAGSVLEQDDQQGVAHFVEHMAFNGTRRFEKNRLIDFAERAGIDFGADLNAYTSYDETVYMLTVPADDASILLTGLDILEDWAGGLSFDPEEVEKERGVVIEEWRRGRGARQRITDQQRRLLFEGSRYAVRDTIGEKTILETVTAESLRDFYRDWYRPELMAVIVVGDMDPDHVEAQIRRRFDSLPASGTARSRPRHDIPFNDATRASVLTDAEASRYRLSLAIKGPRAPVRSEHDYRRMLAASLFSQMLNARLDELRNQPDAPYLFAFNGIRELGRSTEIFQLTAMAKPARFEESLETLLAELERVRRHGFLETELERQKGALRRFYETAHAEKDKTHSQVYAAEIAEYFLREEAMPGIDHELALVHKHLPDIRATEVNALAADWHGRTDRYLLASGPARDTMPAADRLLAIAARADQREVEPYREIAAETGLMTEIPAAGNIIAEHTIEAIGATVWTLSNGARVVAKPTDFKNDEVLLHAVSPGGLSLAADDHYHSAAHAAGIIFPAGLGAHDAVQLGKILADQAVSIRPFINELEEGIAGDAAAADLETLLQLVHLTFTAPRMDPTAFAAWRAQTETFVRNRDLNPQMAFNQELRAFSENYHPRSLPLTMTDLESVDLQTAYAFLRDRYGDAGDFTFVFVGNLDLNRLRRLSEIYLASLPAGGRRESWRDVGVRRPAGAVNLKIEKGLDPKSMVRITWHGDAPWSYAAEADLKLLDEVIEMRLREVLREDLGAVYDALSTAAFQRLPRERYTYTIGFDCAPENVDRLRAAVFAVVEALKRDGIGPDYLDKIRELRRRALEIKLKQNRYWLNQLVRHFRYGTDAGRIVDLERQAIARVGAENIRNAARYYLGANRIEGLLLPQTTR
jgi:zinc protease